MTPVCGVMFETAILWLPMAVAWWPFVVAVVMRELRPPLLLKLSVLKVFRMKFGPSGLIMKLMKL